MMYLTRKIKFSSAHSCRNPDWTDDRNQYVYGHCAVGTGHGHDYICEATIKGAIDPSTGIVVNLVDVKQILKTVITPLDMSHLNYDNYLFPEQIPTTERLTQALWHRLAPLLERCELARLKIYESRTRSIEYIGDDAMVYVTRRVEFNAAHRLHSQVLTEEENVRIFGKCNNPNGHGHNYELEVTICGALDEKTGMVIDMGMLDEILRQEIVARYDHKNLNVDLEEFRTLNPTSEEFARVIWNHLTPHFDQPTLHKVRLVETSNNSFEYFGDQEL
jgi:6-pyruvoyltetrahydropterin/6-carboxytetrahydropterin synthase